MTFHGKLVVRVYLYAEVLTGVDELHQQWELIAELLIDVFAYQQSFVFVDEFNEGQTLVNIVDQATIDGYTLMTWYATDFPTLTDVGLCVENAFERCYLIATPDGGLQKRFKLIRFHVEWRN